MIRPLTRPPVRDILAPFCPQQFNSRCLSLPRYGRGAFSLGIIYLTP